ncbi:class I SAM-dependent methyltransferase [Mycobacterium sp.]|uniref:class I SAM-dependent methyltransferase n=1 Tax=Mycobacterium sp. TaxID=1785 RepID=UPI003D0E524F
MVSTVSDTARWIAAYRAIESARPDALFHDQLADRLAGERGHAIAAAAPPISWALVARTKVIDDLIMAAISDGCDRVLNLAAGLDTRPYRLDLPPDLTWIEADLPALLTEKERLLAGQTPRCRLSRQAVDLADTADREAFLIAALAGAKKALVLTEGLLMYLPERNVSALSAAFTRPEIGWWVFDLWGAGLRKWMDKKTKAMMQNAPFTFAPRNGVAHFENLGWTTVDVKSLLNAADRFHRLPLGFRFLARLPQPDPRKPGNTRWNAVVSLTHSAAAEHDHSTPTESPGTWR